MYLLVLLQMVLFVSQDYLLFWRLLLTFAEQSYTCSPGKGRAPLHQAVRSSWSETSSALTAPGSRAHMPPRGVAVLWNKYPVYLFKRNSHVGSRGILSVSGIWVCSGNVRLFSAVSKLYSLILSLRFIETSSLYLIRGHLKIMNIIWFCF